jgi:hypothetical protein
MLIVVEDAAERRAGQRAVERSMRAQLPLLGRRSIGFPGPGKNREERIYSKGAGELWCTFLLDEDAPIPRYWNAYGVYDDSRGTQSITVEINIATRSNSMAVAGFLAKDPETGAVYLMHDGGVGGGRKGVGKAAFLAWSGSAPTVAQRRDGTARDGILLGRVDSPHLASRIGRYVAQVRAFKDAVAAGSLDTDAMRRKIAEWEEYQKEASGRRRGRRRGEIDYVSYHGDIVDLLKLECEGRSVEGEKVLNSPLIDLYVRAGSTMTEIYEVKTSLSRQTIYTAIGQLLTHSSNAPNSIRRTLVLPEGDMPDGIEKSLAALGIAVRRFRLGKGTSPRPELLRATPAPKT